MEIDVAAGRRFGARHAVERTEGVGQLLRDGSGRLAQDACQLECNRDGQIAQLPVRRVLNGYGGQRRCVEVVQFDQPRADPLPKRFVQLQDQMGGAPPAAGPARSPPVC